jgi:hypothetical protein
MFVIRSKDCWKYSNPDFKINAGEHTYETIPLEHIVAVMDLCENGMATLIGVSAKSVKAQLPAAANAEEALAKAQAAESKARSELQRAEADRAKAAADAAAAALKEAEEAVQKTDAEAKNLQQRADEAASKAKEARESRPQGGSPSSPSAGTQAGGRPGKK